MKDWIGWVIGGAATAAAVASFFYRRRGDKDKKQADDTMDKTSMEKDIKTILEKLDKMDSKLEKFDAQLLDHTKELAGIKMVLRLKGLMEPEKKEE